MKYFRLFLLLPGLLLISALQAKPVETYIRNFRISEIIDHPAEGEFLVSVHAGAHSGLYAGAEGKALALWNSGDPDGSPELGTARVQKIDDNHAEVFIEAAAGKRVEAGDLVALEVKLPELSYTGLLLDLALLDIGILNGFEEPLLHPDRILWDNQHYAEETELAIMVEDVVFVAQEVRKQMEDPLVDEGPYEGKSLFTVMEEVTAQDLLDFYSYIKVRPVKYQGHDWKLSEIYATWVMAGAPKPVTQLDLMIEEINNQIESQKEGPVEEVDLFFDVKKGTLNKVGPDASPSEVKNAFPFFTGETEEGAGYNCDGGVFFLKHDFYFYTSRDFLEIRQNFKGSCSIELLSRKDYEVEQKLGKADKVLEIDGNPTYTYFLYKMKYGTLVVTLHNDSGTVSEIAAYARKIKDVEICW